MSATAENLDALPEWTALALVREILARGAKVYRMRATYVFVITRDPKVAAWLLELGARGFLPRDGTRVSDVNLPVGAYHRAVDGPVEWDLYVHTIPVAGEMTIWEAVGELDQPTVKATDFA